MPTEPFFTRGAHTLQVSNALHKLNRDRLVERLRENKDVNKKSVVILKGGTSLNRWDTDVDPIFRQESNFWWAFGVEEENCYGAINIADGKSVLFVPRLPEDYAIWSGKILPLEHFHTRYGTDYVHYTDEIVNVLEALKPQVLYILDGSNENSKLPVLSADFEGIKNFEIDKKLLYPEICDLRVYKTPMELEVMRYSNKISSKAHRKVMQRVRVGQMEYQIESMFLFNGYYYGGARHVAYCNICTSGQNGAVLHYGHAGAPNNKQLRDGDMCLIDMGLEYYCYASDVTVSYPANGKFTKEQRIIYEAVLRSRTEVEEAIKPGVSWVDMHLLADRIHLEELTKAGLLQGDIDEMMKVRLGAVFMPHGLGHLMGIDVHDVGGYLPHTPPRPKEPGLKNLRTARILEPNMVLTVEPGIYFIDSLIEKAYADPKQNKFLVREMIEKYRKFGGVRLEDGIIVTENGMELMTDVPRTVQEIEEVMAEGQDIEVDLPQLDEEDGAGKGGRRKSEKGSPRAAKPKAAQVAVIVFKSTGAKPTAMNPSDASGLMEKLSGGGSRRGQNKTQKPSRAGKGRKASNAMKAASKHRSKGTRSKKLSSRGGGRQSRRGSKGSKRGSKKTKKPSANK